jgi:hypothetical protein
VPPRIMPRGSPSESRDDVFGRAAGGVGVDRGLPLLVGQPVGVPGRGAVRHRLVLPGAGAGEGVGGAPEPPLGRPRLPATAAGPHLTVARSQLLFWHRSGATQLVLAHGVLHRVDRLEHITDTAK